MIIAIISSGMGDVMDGSMDGVWKGHIGNLYALDLNSPDSKIELLKLPAGIGTETFHPHGLSVLEKDDGTIMIYVVNHVFQDERIEKIQFIPATRELIFIKSIKHEKMQSLMNNLVVLGEDQFYFTIFMAYTSKLSRFSEALLGLRTGSVGFYDNGRVWLYKTKFSLLNGINLSKDKKSLYVINNERDNFLVFDRYSNNTINLMKSIPLYSQCDNIFIDTNDDIYIGCHPKFLDCLLYLMDPSKISPSQVLKLVRNGNEFKITEAFLDDGSYISGSSSVAINDKTLLVGSIHTELVRCRINREFLP